MKIYVIASSLLAIAIVVSACGAEPPPTMSALDVQNTAVAAAFTMVAQTQAAIPTVTPLPPTEIPTQTPVLTDTPIPLPTTQATITSVAVFSTSTSSGGDPCATRVLSGSPKGQETTIRIVNTTKLPVTVSLYLNETASHGECGYRAYNLSGHSNVVITDLVQGCYNLWAWSTDPKSPFNSASGTSCINNPDKWTFEISTATIKFVGP